MTSLLLWMEKTHMKKWKGLVGTGKAITHFKAAGVVHVQSGSHPELMFAESARGPRECPLLTWWAACFSWPKLITATWWGHKHTQIIQVYETINHRDLKLVFTMDIYFFIFLSSLGQFRLSTTHRQLWKSECFIPFGSSIQRITSSVSDVTYTWHKYHQKYVSSH